VPETLIAKWIIGVKGLHEQDGWDSMPRILWDKDTMTFIGCSRGLMEMLKVATKSWRSSKRHEAATYLASIVLAIESLGSNFAGWGDRLSGSQAKGR